MVRSSDVSPLGTKSTLLRSNRSVVALLTDVAFIWAVPSARMVIGVTSRLVPLLIQSHAMPMHYIRVACVWWCRYYLPIVLGGVDPLNCYCPILTYIVDLFVSAPPRKLSLLVVFGNDAAFCPWTVPAVLYPPSLVVDYSVFHTNDSLDIRIDFLRRGGIN